MRTQSTNDEETGEEQNLHVSVQFHPMHVDVFCLPAVLDVAERGYSSLSYVYSLSLFLLDEHDLPLYSGFFPFSYFFLLVGRVDVLSSSTLFSAL
jgi:hypothetical protein